MFTWRKDFIAACLLWLYERESDIWRNICRLSSPKRKLEWDKNDLNKHWEIIGNYSLEAERRNMYMQIRVVCESWVLFFGEFQCIKGAWYQPWNNIRRNDVWGEVEGVKEIYLGRGRYNGLSSVKCWGGFWLFHGLLTGLKRAWLLSAQMLVSDGDLNE